MPPSKVFAALGLQKSQVNRIWEELDEALKAADIMALIQTALAAAIRLTTALNSSGLADPAAGIRGRWQTLPRRTSSNRTM